MTDDKTRWRARWVELAHSLGDRAATAGLNGVVGAIGDAIRPLAPLAAQFLWFVQPAFGAFGQAEAVGALAELFEGSDAFRQPAGDGRHLDQPESR